MTKITTTIPMHQKSVTRWITTVMALVDEDDAIDAPMWYQDLDADGQVTQHQELKLSCS